MKFRLLVLLLGLVLLATTLSGCGLFAKEPPEVRSVTLTDQIDATTKAAKTSLTNFPKGTRLMYVAVQVANPRKGTKLEARWFYDKDGTGSYLEVDRAEILFDSASRDRYGAFSLEAATPPFPAGPYKVQVFLDGQQVKDLPFRVEP